MRKEVGTSLYAGFLFTVLGATAWATGQPFVFPSLGPLPSYSPSRDTEDADAGTGS